MVVEIFTDGACSGNPGVGGWGVLLRCNGVEKRLSGYDPFTTNNRMEMRAAIEGVMAMKKEGLDLLVVTDSMYLKDGITSWIHGWKRNGWLTKEKKMVKNVDLWKRLDQLLKKHRVEWEWVKGHNDHRENEIADRLATGAIEEFYRSLDLTPPTKQMGLFDKT